MKKPSELLLLLIIIFCIGCSTQEPSLSQEDRDKLESLVKQYSNSSGLTTNREFILTIDDKIVNQLVAGRTLAELDINDVLEFSVLSNDSTIQNGSKTIKYDLITIITKASEQTSKSGDSAYQYILEEKSDWLQLNPNPIIVINGRPFRHEHEYRTFLEALKKSDIKAINVLKEPSSLAIYNYKSTLLVSTY
ncbi:hypothetical protein [Reichenbachiella ulvae]|uniref:Uncharacterized protein n=1 Tax=Reichenbachiella ulvae TaxID=2980104 RepID=A0ABT3CXP6_9BACT|nr:hypothetical protein [Reichenbachiella ulvae]MCV9388309.1 hypothetical protein [Reichenbachiella ulvae]